MDGRKAKTMFGQRNYTETEGCGGKENMFDCERSVASVTVRLQLIVKKE